MSARVAMGGQTSISKTLEHIYGSERAGGPQDPDDVALLVFLYALLLIGVWLFAVVS